MNLPIHAKLSNWALLRLTNVSPHKTEKIIFGIALLGILAAIGALILINLGALLLAPGNQDSHYLIQDFMLAIFLVSVGWIYTRGKIRTAAYILLIGLTLFSSCLFTPDMLNRSLIIFVFPILLASFVLQPSYSFPFASISTLGYTINYFVNFEKITYSYNYFAVMIFFLTALVSWMVAHFLKRANQEIVRAYERTLEGWALALQMRDDETNGHSVRVIDLTEKLARKISPRCEDLSSLRHGALLHDIGKIGIPDRILLKPGPLDVEEWNLMHQHPILALDLLSSMPYLQGALDIPYCHHEKWDGSGYPRGLRGEDIPLSARMFTVVDVWDALTSDRPYRTAWSKQAAVHYLSEQSGKQFDPQIIPLFLCLLQEEGIV